MQISDYLKCRMNLDNIAGTRIGVWFDKIGGDDRTGVLEVNNHTFEIKCPELLDCLIGALGPTREGYGLI